MEIHRRKQTSNSNDGIAIISNVSSSTPGRKGGRTHKKSYGPPVNPYTSSGTMTDVILLRMIQLLLLLAAVWFIYLMAIVNSPSLENAALLRGQSLTVVDPKDVAALRDRIEQLRNEFYTRYGGKEIANDMLKRGLRTYEKKRGDNAKGSTNGSIRATANRFLGAIVRHESSSSILSTSTRSQQPEFVMAFAGYSVTVGRGNHLEQSYPFILEKILSPILKSPPFNIKLTVRNSAIGGIPSFPYGWCLSNFLGEDADMVSWDYGMNEGNGASGLESYVRQALLMPKTPPMFVMLDMNSRHRLDLLQEYVDLDVLPDPIALGGRDAVDKKLLLLPEKDRPSGLQKWDEWGAPKGAPGQSPWHPKKMEHELMGWMLAMHMIDALDIALDVIENDPAEWRNSIIEKEMQARESPEVIFPPPVLDVSKTGIASMLDGVPVENDSSKWHMNHISCRTSFLPNLHGDLNSIIQSGVTKDDEDMLKTRDDSLFNRGWVMDVGKLERETKLKVQKYGGLGYVDMKTAMYGIPSSGVLKLLLPYEARDKSSIQPAENDDASKYIKAIVLCEVNEKRGDHECKMASDLDLRIGGIALPSKDYASQVKGVASYLKKDICIHVEIPEGAKLSSSGGSEIGLSVEVTVQSGSSVTRENGACSISHVIWENII